MAEMSRAEAIELLEKGAKQMNDLLAKLSDDDMEGSATIGDGDWSVKDLMGHIAWWEEIALESLADWRNGVKPWIDDAASVDAVNARNVTETRKQTLEEVRQRARLMHRNLIGAIRGISDEEWDQLSPYPTDKPRTLCAALGGILAAPDEPFRHAFAHLPDLEKYAEAR
jgi:hypothetical protein